MVEGEGVEEGKTTEGDTNRGVEGEPGIISGSRGRVAGGVRAACESEGST